MAFLQSGANTDAEISTPSAFGGDKTTTNNDPATARSIENDTEKMIVDSSSSSSEADDIQSEVSFDRHRPQPKEKRKHEKKTKESKDKKTPGASLKGYADTSPAPWPSRSSRDDNKSKIQKQDPSDDPDEDNDNDDKEDTTSSGGTVWRSSRRPRSMKRASSQPRPSIVINNNNVIQSNQQVDKQRPKARSNSPSVNKLKLQIHTHSRPEEWTVAGQRTKYYMKCGFPKCFMAMNDSIFRRSDHDETDHHGIHGMPTKDGGVHPEDSHCTVCHEEGHVAMKCPTWMKPSAEALQKIEEINRAERQLQTNYFRIDTPDTSRRSSPGDHSKKPPLSGVHINKSDEDSGGIGSGIGSQAGASDHSSVRSYKRPNESEHPHSPPRRRKSSRDSLADPEREEPYPRVQMTQAWKDEKVELNKKLDEHKLENKRLKREKEDQEKDSAKKGEKIKDLLKKAEENKEVEKEIRGKLKDSIEGHEVETSISDHLREEVLRSRDEADQMQKKHSENRDQITKLGEEAVKHQNEKDELATKVYDTESALRKAEENKSHAETRSEEEKRLRLKSLEEQETRHDIVKAQLTERVKNTDEELENACGRIKCLTELTSDLRKTETSGNDAIEKNKGSKSWKKQKKRIDHSN